MLCAVTRPQATTTMHLPAKAVKVRDRADLCLTQDRGPTVLKIMFHNCDSRKQISLFFKLTFLQRILIYSRNALSNTLAPDSYFYNIF